MAGSRESGDGASELVAVEPPLRRDFFSGLLPSEGIVKPNMFAGCRVTGRVCVRARSMQR
jgi:hypothetical protein